jgi:hypothetical protein
MAAIPMLPEDATAEVNALIAQIKEMEFSDERESPYHDAMYKLKGHADDCVHWNKHYKDELAETVLMTVIGAMMDEMEKHPLAGSVHYGGGHSSLIGDIGQLVLSSGGRAQRQERELLTRDKKAAIGNRMTDIVIGHFEKNEEPEDSNTSRKLFGQLMDVANFSVYSQGYSSGNDTPLARVTQSLLKKMQGASGKNKEGYGDSLEAIHTQKWIYTGDVSVETGMLTKGLLGQADEIEAQDLVEAHDLEMVNKFRGIAYHAIMRQGSTDATQETAFTETADDILRLAGKDPLKHADIINAFSHSKTALHLPQHTAAASVFYRRSESLLVSIEDNAQDYEVAASLLRIVQMPVLEAEPD